MKNEEIQKAIDDLGEITLSIDYAQTVEQIVATSGHDLNLKAVTENFPIPEEFGRKKMEVIAKLFYFNHSISSGEVISKMDKAGYRPAILVELLSLGTSYPEILRQFNIHIIALGYSVFQYPFNGSSGGCPVPILQRRGIEFLWFHYRWFTRPYFLAIRK
ncbi:MAG: hypothetical protein WAW11_00015 [Patescibacteria group bacterium]